MNGNARKHKVCISLSRCLCILRWNGQMSQSGEMHNSKVGWPLNDYVDATYYPRVVNEYGEYDTDAKQQLKDDENDDLIWLKTRMQGECLHIQQLSPWGCHHNVISYIIEGPRK